MDDVIVANSVKKVSDMDDCDKEALSPDPPLKLSRLACPLPFAGPKSNTHTACHGRRTKGHAPAQRVARALDISERSNAKFT